MSDALISEEIRQRVAGFALKLVPLGDEEIPKAPEPIPEKAKRRFQVISHKDLMDLGDEEEYHIDKVIPKAGLTAIYGPSGSCKSFLALDMACALARGAPWAGIPTEKKNILYIVAEGAGDFRKRIKACWLFHRKPDEDYTIGLIETAPNLGTKADINELLHDIKAWGPVDLIFVDTLARTMTGMDENAAKDMGTVITHCGYLNEKTGATVVLVHHTGKDETRGMRGSGSLKAAVDSELEVSRRGDDVTLEVKKIKGAREGTVFKFLGEEVSVGMTKTGKSRDTFIVHHKGTMEPGEALKAAKKRESPVQDKILIILQKTSPLTPEALWDACKKEYGMTDKSNHNVAIQALLAKKAIKGGIGGWFINDEENAT